MSYTYFTILTIGLLCTAQLGLSFSIKTWNANTNFDNPSNWEGNKIPCPNDRAIFPASASIAVFMPQKLSVAELVLALNGAYIFPLNAELNITGGAVAGECKGKNVVFRSNEDYWYNPDNWNLSSNMAFPQKSEGRNRAVPHAFQVPCGYDEVRFPQLASFRVLGPGTPTSIGSLYINDVALAEDEFGSFVESPTGRLLFPDPNFIHVSESSCTDPTGCLCANQRLPSFVAICLFKSPCPEPECFDPIPVTGHCCLMCAAKVTVRIQPQFKMTDYLRVHQGLYDQKGFNDIEAFVAKISEHEVQTVIVDNTPGNQRANQMAGLLYSIFFSDLKGERSYGVSAVNFTVSKNWKNGSRGDNLVSSGLTAGEVAGILVVIALILGFTVIYIYKRHQIPGFSFARFDLRSDKIELELGTTPHDELEPDDTPSPTPTEDNEKGFDNPVYGTDLTSQEPSGVEECLEVRDFVENPMFMILENQPKEDTK